MTALSSTVTPTRRLFCVISTTRFHQADECSSSWRESVSLNLRRSTGTEYRPRSGTRHSSELKATFIIKQGPIKICLFFHSELCPFIDMFTLAWGQQHYSLLNGKYTSLQRWSFTLPSEWQWFIKNMIHDNAWWVFIAWTAAEQLKRY